MGTQDDGVVTFQEFSAWWKKVDMSGSQSKVVEVVRELVANNQTHVDSSHPISLDEDLVTAGFEKWYASPSFEFDGPLEDVEETKTGKDETSKTGAKTGSTDPNPLIAEEMTETRKQLEELQIKTISGLVEPLQVEMDGQSVENKLLYLSNRQAKQFDMSSLSKVLAAMDVPTPKLIITIMESMFEGRNPRSKGHMSQSGCSVISSRTHSEMDEWELIESVHRMESFMEDIVLPIAVQTHALVICDNASCNLRCVHESLKFIVYHRLAD